MEHVCGFRAVESALVKITHVSEAGDRGVCAAPYGGLPSSPQLLGEHGVRAKPRAALLLGAGDRGGLSKMGPGALGDTKQFSPTR